MTSSDRSRGIGVAIKLAVLGLAACVLLGLLGACFAVLGAIKFADPARVLNDTATWKAKCFDTELLPDMETIGPGMRMIARYGGSCPVFDANGAYVACIRPQQLISGQTTLVSEADKTLPAEECPNSGVRPKPLVKAEAPSERLLPGWAETVRDIVNGGLAIGLIGGFPFAAFIVIRYFYRYYANHEGDHA
jgi:hypothetical protein